MASFEITARTTAPYAAVCYIRCYWPDGSATRASGVVVGVNDVLTALHVVFNADRGGWASSIQIVPAADTAPFFVMPFGMFDDVGSVIGRSPNWDLDGDGLLTAQESAGDLALIGLYDRIGDITGIVPVAQVNQDFSGQMVGYPASGSGMMAENVLASPDSGATVYDINADLGAGSSGGPLFDYVNGKAEVAGVLSAGDDVSSWYAGLFSDATWQWLLNAMAANDTLLGYSAGGAAAIGMTFTGTASADSFVGTAARDTFTGLAGNDTLDGGAGIDLAVYSGNHSDYQLTVSGTDLTVRDLVARRDGTDTLHNIERVKFSDVYMAFDVTGDAGEAYRLYQAAFNRAPDIPGLGFQINSLDIGFTLTQIAGNFLDSPEFQARYGALDNVAFVTQLYRNVLHREPEPAGLAYHVANLDAGVPRSWILANFSESPENQANVIGAIQNGMIYTL